jgi:hypothetical protein
MPSPFETADPELYAKQMAGRAAEARKSTDLIDQLAQAFSNREARLLAEAKAAEKPMPPKPWYFDSQTPVWKYAWYLAAQRDDGGRP